MLGFDIVISAVGDALCAKQPEYIDAAIAGGVKHFYPAECTSPFPSLSTTFNSMQTNLFLRIDGANLDRNGTYQERYFTSKLLTRRHIEKHASEHPDFGYTLIMTGIFSDFFLEKNIIGLSADRKNAIFTGTPQTRLSTTHSTDVSKLIVTSLLPSHLKSLSEKRKIQCAGQTLNLANIFGTVEKALGHKIAVTWISKEENLEKEKVYLEKGDLYRYTFSSAARSIAWGE